jgi:hypothetical protein
MPNEKPQFWYVDQNMDIDNYIDHADGDKVCEECGCADIEERLMKWYKVNGGECTGDGEADGILHDPYYWCPYCKDTGISVIDFSEWKENNVETFFTKKGE